MSSNYRHLATLSIEEVLPKIGTRKKRAIFVVDGQKYDVKANSTRLNLFRGRRTCVECGRVGNIFCIDIQRSDKDAVPHLNLYCHEPRKGNSFVLMTKDHTIPDRMGGLNIVANMECMCTHCNAKKAGKLRNVDIQRMCSTKAGKQFLKRNWKHASAEQQTKWEVAYA